jgi:hypothetical protein
MVRAKQENLYAAREDSWREYRKGSILPGRQLQSPWTSAPSSDTVSFRTLALSLAVLLIGPVVCFQFYAATIWHGRRMENPLYDLRIVDTSDPTVLSAFCQKAADDLIPPALQELDRLARVRKSTRRGTFRSEEYGIYRADDGRTLKALMHDAKTVSIPKVLETHYNDVLIGVSETYRSWESLEKAMTTQDPAERERGFDQSVEYSKRARKHLETQRAYFQERC